MDLILNKDRLCLCCCVTIHKQWDLNHQLETDWIEIEERKADVDLPNRKNNFKIPEVVQQ